MKKLCVLSIAALLATAGAPLVVGSALAATKLSSAECSSIWGRASGGGATLNTAQAKPYVSNFAKVDTDNDGTISQNEFMAGCNKGMVHGSASSGASEGSAGRGNEAPKGHRY